MTTNHHELLENPEVEAVYCAVLHMLHEQMYCNIISSVKHLLGEKPFGIDKRANDHIMNVIKDNPNVSVRCSSEFPFTPAMQKLTAMIEQKRFGKIIEVEAGFLHSSDLGPQKPINWKRIIAMNGEAVWVIWEFMSITYHSEPDGYLKMSELY